MVVRLRVASLRTQPLPEKWIVAWRAASAQVEAARSAAEAEAEAHAGEAWKLIGQPS